MWKSIRKKRMEYIHFHPQAGGGLSLVVRPGEFEVALVVLSGSLGVMSNRGEWPHIANARMYLRGCLKRYTCPGIRPSPSRPIVIANSPWHGHPPGMTTRPPDHLDQVSVEIRGGDNATRQINGIIRPGFDCDRLVWWKSTRPVATGPVTAPQARCPPVDEDGKLLEADLEEVYYYRSISRRLCFPARLHGGHLPCTEPVSP